MTSLPKATPGVVAYGAGDVRVTEVPLHPPADDEAVLEVAYGGVCGSDLHYWTHGAAGESILRQPMVLGHEVAGTVLVAAADGSGPEAGSLVTVHPATPGDDGHTRYPHDRPNLSPLCTYLGSAARMPHRDGAFAKLVTLPSRMLRVLPDTLDLRTATLIEPTSVAWHAVARAGDIRGKVVLVIGAGPIGALMVAALRSAGAAEIVAVDLHPYGLEIAQSVGATRALRADQVDDIAAVEADVSIESSGTARGLASAVRGVMRGGRVVMVGLLPPGEQPVPISLAIARELELVGSFRFNDEIDEVIRALAEGRLDIAPVVTHEFSFDRALEAFEVAKDAARSSKVLLSFRD